MRCRFQRALLYWDDRVREAISFAINEAAIDPELVHVPNWPSLEGAEQLFDPPRARAFLEEAGFGAGFDGLCIGSGETGRADIAQAMAAQLAEIGIIASAAAHVTGSEFSLLCLGAARISLVALGE